MIRNLRKWHLWLVYPAFMSMLVYVLSTISHPLMAWTGPQTKLMHPPTMELSGNELTAIPRIVEYNGLKNANIAKYVPYKDQMLLQVTEGYESQRRYFHSSSYNELKDHDEKQAIWLASHYMQADLPIRNIEFIDSFSDEYPSINRLLPVYQINFDTQDNLSILIHTETQAVAAITNDWKRILRRIFQLFHSLTWLDNYESLRLLLSLIMLTTLVTMTVTGIYLLIKLKRKSQDRIGSRRWHRKLAYIFFVPLFMFLFSGIYHLLNWSGKPDIEGLRLTETLPLQKWQSGVIPEELDQKRIHQISLLWLLDENTKQHSPYYRVSVSNEKSLERNQREKRFAGRQSEKQAIYLRADNKLSNQLTERDYVHKQASNFLVDGDAISQMNKVTRFGVNYDFRNKRLPVWQVDTDSGIRLFIDPVSHSLVDRNQVQDRVEQYSFSFLHKWNMLMPLTGRFYRDVLIVLTLLGILTLTGLGLWRHTNTEQGKTKRIESPSTPKPSNSV